MMKTSSAPERGQLHRGSSGKTGFNEQENKKALDFCPVKVRKNKIYCAKKTAQSNCEAALKVKHITLSHTALT